jgi:flagellar motor switch protein FliM
MPRIQNHFSHIWYDVLSFTFVIWNLFFNLKLYQTLGPKSIAHFVGMHVGMGQKIIMETQITIDPLNGVV